MQRICLFAGYDANQHIHDYVIYYINKLSEIADVYYMADCEMSPEELGKLSPYVKGAFARRHGKYDFGSWSDLVGHIGWDIIARYDQLILCNDSCYGPLFPLSTIFDEMDQRNVDFWGLTQNLSIQRHLQSFFLVFNKKCLLGDELKKYLCNVEKQKNVQDVILKYEIPLTCYMEYFGYKSSAFIKCVEKQNLTVFTYSLPICYRFPFIKIRNIKDPEHCCSEHFWHSDELFDHFPDYPRSLISSHVKELSIKRPRQFSLDNSDKERAKENRLRLERMTNLKFLIHLHVYYHEQIPYYLEKLNNISHYDYILVVTMVERNEFSESLLQQFNPSVIIKIVENRGYDVGPFISVLHEVDFTLYDYVIKLHTKKCQDAEFVLGNYPCGEFSWRNELVESFLGSEHIFNQCVSRMSKNPSIGMIGAENMIFPHTFCLSKEQIDMVYDEEERLIGFKNKYGSFDFIAGSIFLARSSVFMPILNSDVNIDSFDYSGVSENSVFSRANIYERLFGVLVAAQGLLLEKVDLGIGKSDCSENEFKNYKYNMKVSIIVTSYNYANYITETLDSLLSQTWKNWEALVIDDGSSDESKDIIIKYTEKDDRIKYLEHEGHSNKGLAESVKLGVERASGDYIAFCESDDRLHPSAIELQVQKLEKYPDAALSFSSVKLIGDKEYFPQYEKYIEHVKNIISTKGEPIHGVEVLKETNPIFTFSCVVVRSCVIKKCNFDSPYQPYLDWWLWRQIGHNNKIIFNDIPLTFWRVHGKSFMRSVDEVEKMSCFLKEESDNFIYLKEGEYLKVKFRNSNLFNKFIFRRISNDDLDVYIVFGVVLLSVKKFQEKAESRIFGVKIGTRFLSKEISRERRKSRKYKILSLLPIPGLHSTFKEKYKKHKYRYRLLKSKIYSKEDNVGGVCDERNKIQNYNGINENTFELVKYIKSLGKKTIFLVSHEASNTGAPHALLNLGKVLREENYIPVFFSPIDGDMRKECDLANIPFIVDDGVYLFNDFASSKEMLCRLAEMFDLVIVNSAANSYVLNTLRSVNVKKIWWLHEGSFYFDNHAPSKDFFYQLCRSVDKVLCVGNYALSITNRYVGKDIAESFVYGVNDETNKFISHDKINDKITFAIPGTVDPRKSQDVFIQAVLMLPKEIIEMANWLVIGNESNSEFVKGIKQTAHGVDSIKFMGNLPHDEFIKKINQSDVVVLPSRDDPMPIVLTEALMLSKTIICSNCTGTSEFISHGENGFVVEVDDAEGLSEIFKELILDRDKLLKIGTKGRRIYDDNFRMNIFRDNIMRIMNDMDV